MAEIVAWPVMTPEENAANGLPLLHDSGNPIVGKPTRLLSPCDRLRNACRQKTLAALNVLHEVVMDLKALQSARLRAACEILDRGWGRPAAEPTEQGEATAMVDAQVSYRARSYEEWQAVMDRQLALASIVQDPAKWDAIRRAAVQGHSPDTIAVMAIEGTACPDAPLGQSTDDWLH